mmetsp:Transcript_41360/g.96895  ORF Transcript_41360/g.96895 Transcript_41360/m.96895 type:complete len:212 (-) Transcript_41360:47-682(-)
MLHTTWKAGRCSILHTSPPSTPISWLTHTTPQLPPPVSLGTTSCLLLSATTRATSTSPLYLIRPCLSPMTSTRRATAQCSSQASTSVWHPTPQCTRGGYLNISIPLSPSRFGTTSVQWGLRRCNLPPTASSRPQSCPGPSSPNVLTTAGQSTNVNSAPPRWHPHPTTTTNPPTCSPQPNRRSWTLISRWFTSRPPQITPRGCRLAEGSRIG